MRCTLLTEPSIQRLQISRALCTMANHTQSAGEAVAATQPFFTVALPSWPDPQCSSCSQSHIKIDSAWILRREVTGKFSLVILLPLKTNKQTKDNALPPSPPPPFIYLAAEAKKQYSLQSICRY